MVKKLRAVRGWVVGRIHQDDLPDYVYHYTTKDAFFSIAESNSLHLSEFRSLNDKKELYHFIDQFYDQLSKRFSAIYNEEEIESIRAAWELDRVVWYSYVLSFTTQADSNTHWSAYADKGEGICVELDSKLLAASAKYQGFDFGPVKYGEHLGREFANIHFEEELESYKAQRQSIMKPRDTTVARCATTYARSIAPFSKREQHGTDSEWRIAVTDWTPNANQSRTYKRCDKMLVRPYKVLQLKVKSREFGEARRFESDDGIVKAIVVGPVNPPRNPDFQWTFLEFIQDKFAGYPQVRCSDSDLQ